MKVRSINKCTCLYLLYSITVIFLFPGLVAVILFLEQDILLWECSQSTYLIWQNLVVHTKHLLIVWYFTKDLWNLQQSYVIARVGTISYDRWRQQNLGRLSKLLQFKQVVSDKTRTIPGDLNWMQVNTGEDKTDHTDEWTILFPKLNCWCCVWKMVLSPLPDADRYPLGF